MSRRPPQPPGLDFRLARMAPGGALWSEAPIRRARRRRLLAMTSVGPAPVVPLLWQDYPDTYTWDQHPDTLTWDTLDTLADLWGAA